MRIALLATTDLGTRCGRALLAERSLETLGLVGKRPVGGDDRIVQAGGGLSGWDLLVADDAEAGIGLAREWDLPVATPSLDPEVRMDGLEIPVLASCDARGGLGPALLAQAAGGSGELLEGVVAWTAPGSPLRTGEPVSFPDPVGSRWARPTPATPTRVRQGTRFLVAPAPPDWLGVVARATLATDEGIVTRTLGVADHPAYLEGIALAAGALALAGTLLEPGLHQPDRISERYLERALEAGLGVASFTERESVPERG